MLMTRTQNARGQPTNIDVKVDTTHEFMRDDDSEPDVCVFA